MLDWIKSRFTTEDNLPAHWPKKLPLLYCLSSWNYSIVGVYSLYIYYNTMLYEGHFVDSLLLITQGYLSYLGDVHYFGVQHYSRVIDKLLAIAFTTRFITRFIAYFTGDIIETTIYTVTFSGGMYCYYNSNKSRENFNDYVYWHTLWHFTFPLGLFVFIYLKTVSSQLAL